MIPEVMKWALMGSVLILVASWAQPAQATPQRVTPAATSAPAPVPVTPVSQPSSTGRPEAGKALLVKHECLNCHSIQGEGGSMGPDLAQVAVRRSHEWLVDFTFLPSEKFPETEMPQIDWKSEQEVEDIVAFLESIKREVPVDKIFAANLGLETTGEVLVDAYGCRNCHIIGEGGIVGYPELTFIGSKIRPEWERRWLEDPQKVKPGTFMPTFGFSDRELDAVVAYLSRLKWDSPPEVPGKKKE